MAALDIGVDKKKKVSYLSYAVLCLKKERKKKQNKKKKPKKKQPTHTPQLPIAIEHTKCLLRFTEVISSHICTSQTLCIYLKRQKSTGN